MVRAIFFLRSSSSRLLPSTAAATSPADERRIFQVFCSSSSGVIASDSSLSMVLTLSRAQRSLKRHQNSILVGSYDHSLVVGFPLFLGDLSIIGRKKAMT